MEIHATIKIPEINIDLNKNYNGIKLSDWLFITWKTAQYSAEQHDNNNLGTVNIVAKNTLFYVHFTEEYYRSHFRISQLRRFEFKEAQVCRINSFEKRFKNSDELYPTLYDYIDYNICENSSINSIEFITPADKLIINF